MGRFFIAAGLGSFTLGVAIVVSFLAVATMTEARAPGLEDETAIGLQRHTPGSQPAWFEAPPMETGPALVLAMPAITITPPPGTPSYTYGEPRAALLSGDIDALPPAAPAEFRQPAIGPIHDVNLTFYDCADQGFCGQMYNGEWVYEGAAACSWNLPIGTAFYVESDPTNRIYVCKDRGLLDDTWVDIFWHHPSDGYEWQAAVGRYGTIHVIYTPW